MELHFMGDALVGLGTHSQKDKQCYCHSSPPSLSIAWQASGHQNVGSLF